MAPRDEEGAKVVRMGAKPMNLAEMANVKNKWSEYTPDHIFIALSMSADDKEAIFIQIRKLLHIRVRPAALRDLKLPNGMQYQWAGKPVEAWAVEFKPRIDEYPELLEKGVYEKIFKSIPVFSIPLAADGSIDYADMIKTKIQDPAGEYGEIDYPPYHTRRDFGTLLVHYCMFKMKESKKRRNLETHALVSAREKFIWRGTKPLKRAQDEMDLDEGSEDEELNRSPLRKKSKTATQSHPEPEDRTFYLIDHAVDPDDREAMSIQTDMVKEHLPAGKRWPQSYVQDNGFPQMALSLDKVWAKVTEMTNVQNPKVGGYLLYTYHTKEVNVADGSESVVARHFIVSEGAHLYKLAKAHNDIWEHRPGKFAQLMYKRGRATEAVERWTAYAKGTRT